MFKTSLVACIWSCAFIMMGMCDASTPLIHSDGTVAKPLMTLLEAVGMKNSTTSLHDINAWAQKNLLRKGERWDLQPNRFEPLRDTLKPLLTELGFVDAAYPSASYYDGALIQGALVSRVRLRLQFLIQQWKKGVRFSELYFLTGARPLEPTLENKQTLFEPNDLLPYRKDWTPPNILPTTECEMIQLVWDQTDLLSDMRQMVAVHFINAPMRDQKRPTANDTIQLWLTTNPPPGHYLVVLNAPYRVREEVILNRLAPQYSFDVTGPAALEQQSMAIYLDEVARTIYELDSKRQ